MSKWSDDEFLDGLRRQGDVLADTYVARLQRESDVAFVFRNHEDPEKLPAPLQEFFAMTHELPPDVDPERLRRGEKVFNDYAYFAALVMLAKSLPEGYSAPNLAGVLHISRNLEDHAYRRLLGVLQMVVNVSTPGGFEHRGTAVVTAQRLRLLHAGIRHFARDTYQDQQNRGGIPISLEDMLGTIMGFSILVLDGMKRLGVKLSLQEQEDYYYVWRVFAQLMGLHPAAIPHDTEYVPQNIAEAHEFYHAYSRRNFTSADLNPVGSLLAQANLEMMEKLLPEGLAALGIRRLIPRIYMQELVGKKGCARVGVKPVRGHPVLKWLLLHPLQGLSRVMKRVNILIPGWSELFFQKLITTTLNNEVTFLVPRRAEDLRMLVEGTRAPERRERAA